MTKHAIHTCKLCGLSFDIFQLNQSKFQAKHQQHSFTQHWKQQQTNDVIAIQTKCTSCNVSITYKTHTNRPFTIQNNYEYRTTANKHPNQKAVVGSEKGKC